MGKIALYFIKCNGFLMFYNYLCGVKKFFETMRNFFFLNKIYPPRMFQGENVALRRETLEQLDHADPYCTGVEVRTVSCTDAAEHGDRRVSCTDGARPVSTTEEHGAGGLFYRLGTATCRPNMSDSARFCPQVLPKLHRLLVGPGRRPQKMFFNSSGPADDYKNSL
jgi:hypothetical protein